MDFLTSPWIITTTYMYCTVQSYPCNGCLFSEVAHFTLAIEPDVQRQEFEDLGRPIEDLVIGLRVVHLLAIEHQRDYALCVPPSFPLVYMPFIVIVAWQHNVTQV